MMSLELSLKYDPPSWFDSEEKIERLRVEAGTWEGTPFMANSDTKGVRGGVSCQFLAARIYAAVGFCEIEPPQVKMSLPNFEPTESILECYADGCSQLQRLPFPPVNIRPGDLLGFNVKRILHHVGIALNARQFINCLKGGVFVGAIDDPTFLRALKFSAIWRPRP